MSVYIGDVQTFAGVIADKPQVLKIGEETMEVFSAWECWKNLPQSNPRRADLVNEIADVIQAACNLLAAVGVDDMRQPMQECYVRNAERGREYASSDDMDSAVYVQKCTNESCRQYADQGERAELPDCESDSREKLETEVQFIAAINEDDEEGRELFEKMIIELLDRQAAITAIEVARERYDIERDLITARDELQKALNAAAGKWAKADAENRELQAENDGLKARIESLRSKLSKMLDVASAIQHIGDLP